MKHKLVVAMSVLGLISTSAFADDTTSVHKHKHHKKHHHRVAHHDYKATGGVAVQQAPMAEAPAPMAAASVSSVILDQMNQETALNKPMPEWFNRIGISGGINIDTGKWGSRSVSNAAYAFYSLGAGSNSSYNLPFLNNINGAGPGANQGNKQGYTGENTKRVSINNAYLNVAADVNDWTKALAVISYNDDSLFYNQAYTSPLDNNTNASTAPAGQNFGSLNQKVTLEQAKVHFGNFDCSPFFAEVGKQFVDFGRYTTHPITASMTEVMSETLRNALKVGFISDMGIHGSVTGFQNGLYKSSDGNNMENTMNYVAALGYAHPDDQLGYDFGAAWMYNALGANDLSAIVANLNTNSAAGTEYNSGNGGYHNRVASVAAYADVNYDAFSLEARYVTVASHFGALDLPKSLQHSGLAAFTPNAGLSTGTATGAKPWAAGVQLGYAFNAWSRNQNVYLGYQASHDSVFLNLPHSRYVVGYGIDVLKNTKLSAEWDHNNAWNVINGGPAGGNSNLFSVRAAVKFG